MFSLIISVITAVIAYIVFSPLAAHISNWWWAILWTLLVFAATMIGINFAVKKKVTLLMNELQRMMLEGRDTIQKKVAEFQRRPVGDPKTAMAQLEKMQRQQIETALEFTKKLEPFASWTPLLGRQINTTRMQFNYQLKQFKEVDALMPKCIILDPLSGAMKIARQYKTEVPLAEMEKTFKQISSRLRYNQSTLLYSLMAWIYVKNNDEANAYKTLVKACETNENDTLKKNRDRLANGKMREFSNANFGDEWYALFLEEPKMRVERRIPRADGRPF